MSGSAQNDAAGGAALRQAARFGGVVAVFAIVGPLVIAAIVSLVVGALGARLVDALLVWLDLGMLRAVVSYAAWLLAVVALRAAFLPALAAGILFGWIAIYGGRNAIWVAWIMAAIAVAGFVGFGLFVRPGLAALLILPVVSSWPQAAALCAVLGALALIASSLCWWLARPLHRVKQRS
jgi:hypothetical protein